MLTGALDGVYPGKYYNRMQSTQGLRGINRERLQADVANIQALGAQLFDTTAAASEEQSILAVQQLQDRVNEEAARKTSSTAILDILA